MPRPILALILTGLMACASPARGDDPWFAANLDDLVGLYKHLHRNPELSYREEATARRVADELRKAGAEVTTGVGKLGVVGLLKNGEGPTVLIRSDLDALPVREETGLDYASRQTVRGDDGKAVHVMHACGHDVHMACLVGVARWLSAHRERWSGTVVLVGQPAEEMIGGAKAMLADGLYERFPKPDAALALHVTNDQPTGTVTYTSGPAFAGSTSVNVTVKGRGGHGAAPHTTADPVYLAALLVVDLQSVVSRETDPLRPSVVTVGSIHGGTKHNIIPNEVALQLTLRAYDDGVRDKLVEGIRRRVKGLADAHRAPEGVVEVVEGTPPTVNTPALVDRVVPALVKALGAGRVKAVDPVMGAEDFGLFGRGGVPTFMFRVGTIAPDRLREAKDGRRTLPSLHSASYFPEPSGSIETGVRAMSAAALEVLGPGKAVR